MSRQPWGRWAPSQGHPARALRADAGGAPVGRAGSPRGWPGLPQDQELPLDLPVEGPLPRAGAGMGSWHGWGGGAAGLRGLGGGRTTQEGQGQALSSALMEQVRQRPAGWAWPSAPWGSTLHVCPRGHGHLPLAACVRPTLDAEASLVPPPGGAVAGPELPGPAVLAWLRVHTQLSSEKTSRLHGQFNYLLHASRRPGRSVCRLAGSPSEQIDKGCRRLPRWRPSLAGGPDN